MPVPTVPTQAPTEPLSPSSPHTLVTSGRSMSPQYEGSLIPPLPTTPVLSTSRSPQLYPESTLEGKEPHTLSTLHTIVDDGVAPNPDNSHGNDRMLGGTYTFKEFLHRARNYRKKEFYIVVAILLAIVFGILGGVVWGHKGDATGGSNDNNNTGSGNGGTVGQGGSGGTSSNPGPGQSLGPNTSSLSSTLVATPTSDVPVPTQTSAYTNPPYTNPPLSTTTSTSSKTTNPPAKTTSSGGGGGGTSCSTICQNTYNKCQANCSPDAYQCMNDCQGAYYSCVINCPP